MCERGGLEGARLGRGGEAGHRRTAHPDGSLGSGTEICTSRMMFCERQIDVNILLFTRACLIQPPWGKKQTEKLERSSGENNEKIRIKESCR